MNQEITVMERGLFDSEILVGSRESINLNPAVMIHRNSESHWLSIIYTNETTKQTSPSIYEIREGEGGYLMHLNGKRTSITHNPILDILTIAIIGDHIRN